VLKKLWYGLEQLQNQGGKIMKRYKDFHTPTKSSFAKLGTIASMIFLCCFFMIPRNCFSQYIPEAGDRVIITLLNDEQPQLFETASDSSLSIKKLDNGENLKILETSKNWLKVKTVSDQIGWLYVDPEIGNFLLIKLGLARPQKLVPQQTTEEENEFWIVSPSIQYQNIPDTWDVKYYGIQPELFLTDQFSVSGHFYAGRGSDGHAYFHVPLLGLFVSLSLGFILDEVFDGEFWSKEIYTFLLMEQFNYNKRFNNFFMVSPYIGLLGMDVSEIYDQKRKMTALLGNGIGVTARFMLGESVTLGSSIGIKHFIDVEKSFGSNTHWGYTVGFNLGFVLKN